MQHVFAAFRAGGGSRPAAPGASPDGDGDDDDDDGDGAVPPVPDKAVPQAFAVFDALSEVLLPAPPGRRHALLAFDLAHYLCGKLDPGPSRARAWLRRIVASLSRDDVPEDRRTDVAAATHPPCRSPRLLRRAPAAFHWGKPRTGWLYRTDPEPGVGNRAMAHPRGRVLGGSSSIKGMIYMRGQAADYDGWRQSGNVGWAWHDVLPFFMKSEDHCEGPSAIHGAGGELRVEGQRMRWDLLDALRDAAEQAGLPKTADFNSGSSYFHVTQRRGRR